MESSAKVNNTSGVNLAEKDVEKSKQEKCQEQETFLTKKRGRPFKLECPPTVPFPKTYKRGRGRPSKSETKYPQFSGEGGQGMNIADAEFLSNATDIANAELLLSLSLQSEGLMDTHENSCCLRIADEQTDAGVSSGIEKGKIPGVVVANSQAVSTATVIGEKLNGGGDTTPDCTTEKSNSVATLVDKSTGTKVVNDGKASASATGCSTKVVGVAVTSDAQLVGKPERENAGDMDLEGSLSLPFVKSSPFWAAIESGEVIRKFPQNPHFQPLVKYAEVLREGLALGHMMRFVSLVEKTSKLKVHDPREHYDSIMRTLDELEELGFDVNAVRDLVNVKLWKKAKSENFLDQLKQVEVHIGECTNVETKLNDKMKRLEEEKKRLEKEEATLTSKKANIHSKMSCLRSEVDVINEGMSSLLKDF